VINLICHETYTDPAAREDEEEREGCVMNLKTSYMGMKLRTPLVPSASPLSESLDGVMRMEDAGAAAVVLHSLFATQIEQAGADALELNIYSIPTDPVLSGAEVEKTYLEILRRVRTAVRTRSPSNSVHSSAVYPTWRKNSSRKGQTG
jgi:dihydroorotate dehydrogenase